MALVKSNVFTAWRQFWNLTILASRFTPKEIKFNLRLLPQNLMLFLNIFTIKLLFLHTFNYLFMFSSRSLIAISSCQSGLEYACGDDFDLRR